MNFNQLYSLVESDQQTSFSFYDDESIKKLSPRLELLRSLKPNDIKFFKEIAEDENLINDWETQIEVYGEEEFPYFVEEDGRINPEILLELKNKFQEYIRTLSKKNEYDDNSFIIKIDNETIYIFDSESKKFTMVDRNDYLNDPEKFISNYFPKFNIDDLWLSGIDVRYGDLKNNPEGIWNLLPLY